MSSSHHDSDAVPRSLWLILGLILLLAAGLRLTRLGLVEFKYDEATTSRSSLSIAREGQLPGAGMVTSEGPRNPALMSYVLAPPFALSRDPRVAAGWVALLGVAAVGLTFWIGQAFFDWRVGALAALLFAASPWAVFQSRKLWTQNLPLFTLFFVASVLALVARRKRWALVPAMAAVGCLVSLHLGGLAFFFVLGAVLILFRDRVRLGPLVVGAAALLLVLLPYLVHDARHGWPNLRALRNLGSGASGLNLRAFTMAARVMSGLHLQALAGVAHARFIASLPPLMWIDLVEIVLFWLGLLWAVVSVARQAVSDGGRLSARHQALAVLLCWFLIPVALLTRRAPIHPHDFNVLYPVQHLIAALFLVQVLDWLGPRPDRRSQGTRRLAPSVVLLVVGIIVAWQVAFHEALLTFVDNHATPGGHGAPVKDAMAAARRAASLADASDASLIALLPGGDERYDEAAAVFDVLLPPTDNRRLIDGVEAVVLPDGPAVYLVHPEASHAASLLAEAAEEVSSPLPRRSGSRESYRFFRAEPDAPSLEHGVDRERYWLLPPDQHPTAAVRLVAYECEGTTRPGHTFRWTTNWQIEGDPPRGIDLHWFNHLIGDDGTLWGQRDGPGLPVSDWRPGDTVFTWYDITIAADAPPPPYAIRTGVYRYPEVINVTLVDALGNPVGQFLELGPLDEP